MFLLMKYHLLYQPGVCGLARYRTAVVKNQNLGDMNIAEVNNTSYGTVTANFPHFNSLAESL